MPWKGKEEVIDCASSDKTHPGSGTDLAMILSLGLTVQAVGSPVSIELNGTAMELTAPAYIDGQNRTQVPVTIGPSWG